MEKRKILLVGWDAADWQHINPLLDSGKLPALQSLVDGGVMGNLATLQPVLSPMLWNSISTGKQPHKHGVHGFVEPDRQSGARAWSSQSRKTKAIWNILSQSGLKSNVVNWWASHPAEPINGCVVSNLITSGRLQDNKWTLPEHTVHPARLSEEMAELVLHAQELTGEQILPLVPNGEAIDQDNDNRLSVISKHLAEMMTTHNIATSVMESEEWDFMAVYYTAIDHFCHSFIPYHPPKLPWITDADFEMYRDVVNRVYQFSDMTLRRLIDLAGPETTIIVCSDHGFQSGNLRMRQTPNEPAGPAYWHRKYGIFVAAGPGIKKDDRVFGATLLDITPTLLHLFNLPVGKDMDGRVLSEIFENPHPPSTIDSWDDVASSDDGMIREEIIQSENESEQLINQFIALGYVEAQGESKQERYEFAETEAKFNLARNLLWSRKFDEAIAVFYELVAKDPWETRFIFHLAKSLITGRCYLDAVSLLEHSFDLERADDPNAVGLWANAVIGLGEFDRAKIVLVKLEEYPRLSIGLLLQLGTSYLQIHEPHAAKRVYTRVLESQYENAEAHLGLSSCHLKLGDNGGAADHALESLALVFNQMRAHVNLGLALMRSGNIERATIAFETALKINPNSKRAHRWLQAIYSKQNPNAEKAKFHAAEARKPVGSGAKFSNNISRPRNPNWDFSMIGSEQERAAALLEKRPSQISQAVPSGKTFLLVSGLPRSGTSLMMQMLEYGGLSPKTDGKRIADSDNPLGYYEWEEIQQIGQKPHLMDEEGLHQKSIKVVSALLQSLPYRHHYKIIFMNRPVVEVAQSQEKMIERLQTEGATWNQTELCRALEFHRQQSIAWLENHPRAEVLIVEYPELLLEPTRWIEKIANFVGSDLLPSMEKMADAINSDLYRNRSK